MSMAAAPAAGTPRARRTIAVSVRDEHNEPLPGAKIIVRVSGVQVATIFSSGNSHIELSDRVRQVELLATVGAETGQLRLTSTQQSATFIFNRVSLPSVFAKPGGRCPDGTEGQPCVTCIIGDESIRVCG